MITKKSMKLHRTRKLDAFSKFIFVHDNVLYHNEDMTLIDISYITLSVTLIVTTTQRDTITVYTRVTYFVNHLLCKPTKFKKTIV